MLTENIERGNGSQPAVASIALPQPRLLYSKKEAAQLLSVSVRQLDYFISMKELKARKLGKRVLISYQVLQEFSRRDHPGRLQ